MNYQRKYKKALWHQIQHPESDKPSNPIKSRSVRRAAIKRSGAGRWQRSTKQLTSLSKPKVRRQLSPLSSRQRQKLKEYAIAKRLWWREVRGSVCPVLLKLFGRQVEVEPKPHHVRGRIGSLLCDTRMWLAVSQEGHDWIHQNINEARRYGWIAQAGDWNKPLP